VKEVIEVTNGGIDLINRVRD